MAPGKPDAVRVCVCVCVQSWSTEGEQKGVSGHPFPTVTLFNLHKTSMELLCLSPVFWKGVLRLTANDASWLHKPMFFLFYLAASGESGGARPRGPLIRLSSFLPAGGSEDP